MLTDVTIGNSIIVERTETADACNLNLIEHLIGVSIVFKCAVVRNDGIITDVRGNLISVCNTLTCFQTDNSIQIPFDSFHVSFPLILPAKPVSGGWASRDLFQLGTGHAAKGEQLFVIFHVPPPRSKYSTLT